MFEIFGEPRRTRDGVTRRRFLQAGGLGFVGLSLADLLRAEAASGVRSSAKSVINIHLDGGPPQLDTIDLKADAPSEYRGEFAAIGTKLAGFQICELMPKVASIADKFAFVRTLVGSAGAHDAFQCQSGFAAKDLESIGGRPAMGSVVSKLQGSPGDPVPSFVDLMQGRALVRNSARPGFLGPAYQAFRPDISEWFSRPLEEGMKKELAAKGGDHTTSLRLLEGLSAERLNDRTRLLADLDRMRRSADTSGMMDALDRFSRQAVSILTSGKFAAAMDLSREDPRVLERYTPGGDTGDRFVTSEGPLAARKFLLARRLVEAGVRCVSVSISDFDTHSRNFPRMRQLLPIVDHGLHALVTDLEERGLLGDVSIVAWGEFGRTPKVNNSGGRDHWPRVSPAILSGGGMKVGQVIGETDRYAGDVVSRPVHFQDVIATLYRNLGVDWKHATIVDPSGRPQQLLDVGRPIPELV
jgi:uncharacterized protein (DUF1501 family)